MPEDDKDRVPVPTPSSARAAGHSITQQRPPDVDEGDDGENRGGWRQRGAGSPFAPPAEQDSD